MNEVFLTGLFCSSVLLRPFFSRGKALSCLSVCVGKIALNEGRDWIETKKKSFANVCNSVDGPFQTRLFTTAAFLPFSAI